MTRSSDVRSRDPSGESLERERDRELGINSGTDRDRAAGINPNIMEADDRGDRQDIAAGNVANIAGAEDSGDHRDDRVDLRDERSARAPRAPRFGPIRWYAVVGTLTAIVALGRAVGGSPQSVHAMPSADSVVVTVTPYGGGPTPQPPVATVTPFGASPTPPVATVTPADVPRVARVYAVTVTPRPPDPTSTPDWSLTSTASPTVDPGTPATAGPTSPTPWIWPAVGTIYLPITFDTAAIGGGD